MTAKDVAEEVLKQIKKIEKETNTIIGFMVNTEDSTTGIEGKTFLNVGDYVKEIEFSSSEWAQLERRDNEQDTV
jgi:hypothetical protein